MASAGPLSLVEVSYWAYQIQDISALGAVDALAASHYDMLVLEPTRTDWSSNDKFFNTSAMISHLKKSMGSDGVHRKLVIAYIDIGEAEDWRWYWEWSTAWNCTGSPPEDWPSYILACDPDGWGGNYPVAYWDQQWKNIIIYGIGSDPAQRNYMSVLDEVITDGFDGIYMDWIEAFENADVIKAAQAVGKDPAQEMVLFIQEMRAYAAARNPDFILIQQNGAALIDKHPELVTVLDGIAQEAIWFDGEATDDWNDPAGYDDINDPTLTTHYLGYLQKYQDAGLPAFSCEYALQHAGTAYANSLAHGFVPYVSRRSLGKVTTTEPPGY